MWLNYFLAPRNPDLFMKIFPVLGVDIGGSHITTAMVDPVTGLPVAGTEARIHVNSSGTVDEIVPAWAEAMHRSIGTTPASQLVIGIAMPGPFDYEHGICLIREQKKFKSLYHLDLKGLIAEKLDITAAQIFFMNDACAFLEGEITAGASRGQQNVMGITLGTGLGSAFSLNDGIIDADLWNSPYRGGVAEDFLSTRWFIKRFEELTRIQVRGVKELGELTATEPATEIVFREFGENLAGFMMEQAGRQGFTSVVVGGNIAKASPHFSSWCNLHLRSNSSKLTYSFSQLGENAALTGAGAMAYRRKAGQATDRALNTITD